MSESLSTDQQLRPDQQELLNRRNELLNSLHDWLMAGLATAHVRDAIDTLIMVRVEQALQKQAADFSQRMSDLEDRLAVAEERVEYTGNE